MAERHAKWQFNCQVLDHCHLVITAPSIHPPLLLRTWWKLFKKFSCSLGCDLVWKTPTNQLFVDLRLRHLILMNDPRSLGILILFLLRLLSAHQSASHSYPYTIPSQMKKMSSVCLLLDLSVQEEIQFFNYMCSLWRSMEVRLAAALSVGFGTFLSDLGSIVNKYRWCCCCPCHTGRHFNIT